MTRRALRLTTLTSLFAMTMTLATAKVRAADGDATTTPPSTADAPPPAPPAPPDPIADEARARIRRGLELYDEGDFRLALIEFERAYKILPSYKILYNLGQVHFQLATSGSGGGYAQAHATLTRYLAEGGAEIPASRRAEVEADLASLMKRIATLTIESNVAGAEIMFDDRPVGPAPIGRTLVDAGAIRIVASKPGYMTATRLITLAGGDELVVRLDLQKALPDMPTNDGLTKLEIGSWIVTGVLTAGAIGTGIATTAAASRFDTMRDAPIQGSPGQAKADLDRQGNLVDALALTTDVLIVTSIIAGGVSLYLTFGRSRSRTAAAPRSPFVLSF